MWATVGIAVAGSMRRDEHPGFIPFLDGIRAVAVLLVIAEHNRGGVWVHLAGYLGVSLFFVLSGYLITTIALREEAKTGTVALRAFYIRRTFRIFPLYYVILAVHCVLVLALHQSASERPAFVHALPYFLTYLQEVPYFFDKRPCPFMQSWTLGIEEKFYLIWPVIAFTLLRGRPKWRIPVAALLAITCITVGSIVEPYASILFGCILALILENTTARKAIAGISVWGSYLGLAFLVFIHILIATGYIQNGKTLYALIFSFVLAFLLNRESVITRLAAWAPLAHMGRWSYAVYLIHRICRSALEGLVHDANLLFLLTCILSFAAAAIISATVEQPLIRVGRRLAASSVQAARVEATAVLS